MNKEQALSNFWNSFGWSAYDESTVPDNTSLPYITFSVGVDDFKYPVSLTASLWDRSTSWATITSKLNQIAESIGQGGKVISYDGGAFWIRKGTPFAQRVSDEDRTIRRIYINVEVEYID